jgi:hypothetical protein
MKLSECRLVRSEVSDVWLDDTSWPPQATVARFLVVGEMAGQQHVFSLFAMRESEQANWLSADLEMETEEHASKPLVISDAILAGQGLTECVMKYHLHENEYHTLDHLQGYLQPEQPPHPTHTDVDDEGFSWTPAAPLTGF